MTRSPFAASPDLPVPPDVTRALDQVWAELGRPGTTLTGEERVGVAREARRARAGLHTDTDQTTVQAARRLGAHPASIRKSWVEEIVDSGLGYERYVEIVGVVSRAMATDTFMEALGREPAPLPEATPGTPTGDISPGARLGAGWVPMAGAASIALALSLVPAENAALERLHGPMYLAFEEMSDPAITRALTRPQMELVAARTSAINECFY